MAAALAVLAAALPAIPAAAKRQSAASDPDRQICKSRPVVGSRLKRIRTCMSAQEWEELELQEELGMMRKQTNGDPGCNYDVGGAQCGIARGGRDTPW
jgi:hypothetical protein